MLSGVGRTGHVPRLLLQTLGVLACFLIIGCQSTFEDPIAGSEGGGSQFADTLGPDATPYERAIHQGQIHDALGDRAAAELAFRDAVALREAAFGSDSGQLVEPLMQLALEVGLQGRHEEAEVLFARIDRLLESPASPWDVPRAWSYRAIALSGRGDLESAYTLAQEATVERRDILTVEAQQGGDDLRARLAPGLAELAHGLVVEGALAFRLGRIEEAELAAALARRILVQLETAPEWWIAEVDELIALIETENEDFESADRRLRAALLFKQRSFGSSRPVALTLMSLGRVQRRRGEPDTAVAVMDDAIDILAGLDSSGSRLSYNRVGDFLLSAHELLRAQPDRASELHGRMFQAVQMIESGLSDRAVSLTVARLAAEQDGVGAQIRRYQDAVTQRDDLRLELGREFSKDTSIRDQARVVRLNDALSRATERASTLTAALGDAGPGIASLLEVTDAELSDVQSSLEENEALLSFVFGREDGFAIAVRSDFVVSSPLPIGRETLVARIQSLRRAFDIGPGQVVPRFDIDGAHALYQLLFGGISDALAGVDHTIVVTDGPLRSLPFGVLVTSPPSQSSDYSGARWLAQSFAISTTPTIRAFYQLRRFAGVSSAPKPVLGFGDPVLVGGGDGEGLQALRDHCQEDEPVPPALIRALEPLPETREEVATIGRLLGAEPGDVVLGASATEQRLRTAELDQYRILYFATHGLLPGEVRCQGEPAIVLTPPSRPSNDFGQDGLISASEIARLRLDADVVVLSACNTGSADGRFGGDALSGLSRAFFSAGARALLVSHWQVDSAVTSTLMQSVFQTAVGDRQRTVSGIARAMRRAQTRLIAQSSTAHPYFWGAFTFIGDGA